MKQANQGVKINKIREIYEVVGNVCVWRKGPCTGNGRYECTGSVRVCSCMEIQGKG